MFHPSLLKTEKKEVGKGEYEVSSPHMQNFIDAVRKRTDPNSPVECGCSTNTLCCIFNIARELNRPVHWNPATLSFGDDKEAFAHRLYYYDYRRPYKLPYLDRRGSETLVYILRNAPGGSFSPARFQCFGLWS